MRHLRLPAIIATVAALTVGAVACSTTGETSGGTNTTSNGPTESITVYSGRSEELVGPLFEQFTQATGITVNARYGDSAELAAQILDEGENSPADVFFAQDAGALGAVGASGQFTELTSAQLDAVPETYRSPNGYWVGVSARARVVVYNTDALNEDQVPDTVDGFTDPSWAGRVGWAPSNGSFQAFVTALRVTEGEEAAGAWLEAMEANDTQVYEKNTAIVAAVAAGEIDAGLVNHYYLYQYLAENPGAPVANKFLTSGAGALVNVAGVGILTSAANPTGASSFVDYLLSPTAQEYFATETSEYPVVPGTPAPEGLPPLNSIGLSGLDLNRLEDLAGTLELLQAKGVV